MTFQPGANLYTAGFGLSPENLEVPHYDTRIPTTSDVLYPVGKRWIYTGNSEWVLLSLSSANGTLTASWTLVTSAGGTLDSLTGDSGGIILPSITGNITLAGTANQILTTGSGHTITSSLIGPYTPATYTAHGVLVGEGTSSIVATAAGTAGQVLQSGGASADPLYSTATYPATATGTGTILRADGTNWSATTATYPATTTANQLLYSSATNVVGGLTSANNGVVTTGTTGTPAVTALLNGQTIMGTGSGTPPLATYFTNNRVTYVPQFNTIPVMSASTGGVAAVTQGTTNVWAIPTYGAYFECFNNVATSIIAPTMSATSAAGVNIGSLIAANSKFVEINEGVNASAKNQLTINTGGGTIPWFVSATFNIASNVNIVTDVCVGFRTLVASQVTVVGASGYANYAMIGVHGTAGVLQSQTQTAGGGNTVTTSGTSVTAGVSFTLKLLIDASGNVTYKLNGSTLTTTSYQLANNAVVIPFMIFTSAAGAFGEVDLMAYSCGEQ